MDTPPVPVLTPENIKREEEDGGPEEKITIM